MFTIPNDFNPIILMPIIILPSVIIILGRLFLLSKKRLPEELGLTPLHTEACSGIIGMLSMRGPFIRVSIYREFLVISWSKKLLLRWSDIEDIRTRQWWLNCVIDIVVRPPTWNKKIVLISMNRAKLLSTLVSAWGR